MSSKRSIVKTPSGVAKAVGQKVIPRRSRRRQATLPPPLRAAPPPVARTFRSSMPSLATLPARHRVSYTVSTGSNHLGHFLRVRGTEYVGGIVIPTGTLTAGQVCYTRINSCNMVNSRIKQFAAIYDRWRPNTWTYRYIPSVPSSTAGTIVMAQDPDVINNWSVLSGAATTVPVLMAYEGATMFQVWQNASCRHSKTDDYTTLWTVDPSTTLAEQDRLDLAGQLVVAFAAPPSSDSLGAGSVLGLLELDYDVEFYVPKLTPEAVEHSITLRIPGSSIASGGFDTSDQNRTLLDQISSLFSRVSSGLKLAGAIRDALSQYISLAKATTLARRREELGLPTVPYEEYGFPDGNYMVRLTACTQSATSWSTSTLFHHPAKTAVNTTYFIGTELNTVDGDDNLLSYYAPDGVIYAQAKQLAFEFGIQSDRHGACDFKHFYVDTATETKVGGTANVVYFVELFLSGQDIYWNATSLSSVEAVVRRSSEASDDPGRESKDEVWAYSAPPSPSPIIPFSSSSSSSQSSASSSSSSSSLPVSSSLPPRSPPRVTLMRHLMGPTKR